MYGSKSYEYKQKITANTLESVLQVPRLPQTFLHVGVPFSPAVLKQKFPAAAIKVRNMFCGHVTLHVKQIL
jgi:hypothetical protein